jgi:NADH dehydrogenase [ubiquinone] 1 alpha subcomplex assembly factor 7
VTPLGRLLARRIRLAGPLTLAQYMAEALGHPEHGYYRTRDPFGAAGDFTTAPEISQIFGELLGLWCVEMWQALGSPAALNLVELGPGRGTLMADALRAARLRPAFRAAATAHLVETSEGQRARQAATLAQAEPALMPVWHDSLATVPDGPMLLLANELFDALPIHQFVRTADGWRERVVALAPDAGADGDSLCFGLAPPGPALALLADAHRAAPVGAIAEVSPAAIALAAEIARRAAVGGAALVIDYGPAASAAGDSLQAVRQHRPADPLAAPGEADLTAHVDFAALARAAREAGATVHGPLPQGTFLARLGLEMRAAALLRTASPAQARDIRAAVARLLDPAEMGTLFKALAIVAPSLPVPPGFGPPA